jgi:hypothetical protein
MAICLSIQDVGSADRGRRWLNLVTCVVVLLFVSCSSDINN